MKPLRFTFYLCMTLLVVLAACAPQATPTGGPSGNNSSSASSSSTGSSESQGQSSSGSSVAPVNLAGPEMKVGSTWLYADGSVLVPVPGGPFTMGQGGPDNPVHQVTLSDFWIYRAKVTNLQYAYCVSQGHCTPPKLKDNPGFTDPLKGQFPVVAVTYDQAAAYCSFVHGRLPTEAEWEKAARGPDANIYPWGNNGPVCDLLNFETCVGNTTPINKYPQGQSYYLALDMEGNTFEWVSDWYKADYYSGSPDHDPLGPANGQQRSVRSSAFNSGTNQTPAASRFFARPGDERNNLGFRCVVEDPAYFAPFCNYPPTYGTDGIGGGSNGTQTTVDCPNLDIQQDPRCDEGNNPYTIVTLNGPQGSIITVPQPPTCTQNTANQYTCTKNGSLNICSSCTVTVTGDPQCPNGYQYNPDSKTCEPGTSGGTCLSGLELGEEHRGPILTSTPTAGGNQCCQLPEGGVVLTRGDESGSVYPVCPAGTSWDGTECISQSIIYPYCDSKAVDLKSCACTPVDNTYCSNSCQYGGQVDPQNPCKCDCNAG